VGVPNLVVSYLSWEHPQSSAGALVFGWRPGARNVPENGG